MAKRPMTTKDKIREWISDNLRYMMLIAGILAAVGLILLIVHLFAGKAEEDAGGSGASVVSSESGTEQGTETPTPTATPSPEAGDGEEPLVFGAENQADVSEIVKAYFTALAAKDLEGIRAVVDELPDEEAAQITAEPAVQSYDDVTVYTVSGPVKDTYIAFVKYLCKYRDIDTPLPMLSEMYLYTRSNGSLVIDNETASDEAVSAVMEVALLEEDAQALLSEVQTAYEEALASDEKLKTYVESLQ